MRRVIAIGVLALLGGCGGEEAAGGAEPAAELAREGYAPDSLAWWREGRPVVHDGRQWQPVGQPVPIAPGALRRVGEFEGMELFAVPEDASRPGTLFFPIGGGLWQLLEPIPTPDSARNPGPDTGPAQRPSGTGTGRSPE